MSVGPGDFHDRPDARERAVEWIIREAGKGSFADFTKCETADLHAALKRARLNVNEYLVASQMIEVEIEQRKGGEG